MKYCFIWKPLIKPLIWRTFCENLKKVNLEDIINQRVLHCSGIVILYLINEGKSWFDESVEIISDTQYHIKEQYWMCWEPTTHSSCESFRADLWAKPNKNLAFIQTNNSFIAFSLITHTAHTESIERSHTFL